MLFAATTPWFLCLYDILQYIKLFCTVIGDAAGGLHVEIIYLLKNILCLPSTADYPTSKAYGSAYYTKIYHIRLSLVYTNLDLTALMLGTSIVCWSNKFHLLKTLFEKNNLVISSVYWVLKSVCTSAPLYPCSFHPV